MRSRTAVPLLDALFILLLALLILLKPPTPDADIIERAEFLVEVTWPDESCSDIDTWFAGPDGKRVYYGSKQAGLWSLDRDDLGCRNDAQRNADGSTTIIKVNREVVTLRGFEPGRYTINLFAYTFTDTGPITATVRFIRLNPFKTEIERQIEISAKGQELTVASLTLGKDGGVSDISLQPVTLTRQK